MADLGYSYLMKVGRLAFVLLFCVSGCGRIHYEPRECPTGTVSAGGGEAGMGFCIETTRSPALPFHDAEADCASRGRRLCADAEWAQACGEVASSIPDLFGEWEWIAETISDTEAGKRGFDCNSTSTHYVGDPYPYRCCADR